MQTAHCQIAHRARNVLDSWRAAPSLMFLCAAAFMLLAQVSLAQESKSAEGVPESHPQEASADSELFSKKDLHPSLNVVAPLQFELIADSETIQLTQEEIAARIAEFRSKETAGQGGTKSDATKAILRKIKPVVIREALPVDDRVPTLEIVPASASQQVVAVPHQAYPIQLADETFHPAVTISGPDIACRAAQNWIPSDLLRQRARTIIQLYCEEDECQRQAAAVLARFLCMQAKHQEDIGAASALKAYYTRIGLAEQLSLTYDSLRFIDEESAKQDAAQEGGLPAGTDLSSFERHRIEVKDNQIQILSKDRQLRCLIAQLSQVDYAMADASQESLDIMEVSLDCQRLKQIALATRNDLRGWIYLSQHVNEESAPIFARMLGTIVGGWGLPIPRIVGLKALLCPPDYSGLARNMKYELDLTVETHRRWICQAIEEKCAALKMSVERVHLARQVVSSWESRVLQLVELDGKKESAAAEIALAKSELLKARADEISRRLDAKIAEIDLAEATGGISDRCCAGFPWLLTGFEQ